MEEKNDALADELDGATEEVVQGDTAEPEAVEAVAADEEAAAVAQDMAGEAADAKDEVVGEAADAQGEVTGARGEAANEAPGAQDEAADAQGEEAQKAEPAAPAEPAKSDALTPAVPLGSLVVVGIFALLLGVLLTLPTFLGLTGGGDSSSQAVAGGVAATVNGTPISEDVITDYIANFRVAQQLDTDEAWGEWMVSFGYEPKQLRTDTINYYVDRELLKQAIQEEGITVEDSEVDDAIAQMAEQLGGQEMLEEALAAQNMDMDSYRNDVRFSLEQQALAQKVAPADVEVNDEDILDIAKMYYPDSAPEDADSIDDIDAEIVEQIRSMLASSSVQQAFTEWMEERRASATIVVNDMPEGLPYDIDLTPYQQAANGDAEDDEVEIDLAEDEADSEGSADAENSQESDAPDASEASASAASE